ncbi:MAG TPA: site-specific integrase [Terriglobales bacterium]|nr:site-specific integrase [Terriglobales bacterium]
MKIGAACACGSVLKDPTGFCEENFFDCDEHPRNSTSPNGKVIVYPEPNETQIDASEPHYGPVTKSTQQFQALSLPTQTGSCEYPATKSTIPTVSNKTALSSGISQSKVAVATPLKRGPKGPMLKRRFQEGTFRKENGHYYSFFYTDRPMPDGSARSVKERFDLGKASDISELSARREHDRLRQKINRERGSVPPGPKGETFKDAVTRYMKDLAPQLSCSTVRQKNSHLNCHLLPRFATTALMAIDHSAAQQFATHLRQKLKAKTVENILGTLGSILDYAKKCGSRTPDISLAEIKVAPDQDTYEAPYFKPETIIKILAELREPYRTIFALDFQSGLRAGELLGLTLADIDLEARIIRPKRQADDRTRTLRGLKTKKSASPVPITPETAAMLAEYLGKHWRPNPANLLFPNRRGRPMKRAYVVKWGLKPVLVKLGLPTHRVAFHAFRHSLGTTLANNKVSLKTVQEILRHTDSKTTARYYLHSDMEDRRAALEAAKIGVITAIGTSVPIGTTAGA